MNRNQKLISILLFIDFRKAFDLVDSRKLLLKLLHYGFDNSALSLLVIIFKIVTKKINLIKILPH